MYQCTYPNEYRACTICRIPVFGPNVVLPTRKNVNRNRCALLDSQVGGRGRAEQVEEEDDKASVSQSKAVNDGA